MAKTTSAPTIEQRTGAYIRVLRERKGWKQDGMAKRLTVAGFPMHTSTYSKLESATRPLRVAEASVIADLLGVELSDLLTSPVPSTEEEQLRRLELELEDVERELGPLRARQEQLQEEIRVRRWYVHQLHQKSSGKDGD